VLFLLWYLKITSSTNYRSDQFTTPE
ncbi:hypothetical protein A2U01_0045895, partial [Trifolium medium]|nr:hypothetical protein [Trifolium medium]